MKAVDFRPYDPATDEGLVYKTWLMAFRGSHYAGPLPRPIYYAAYREMIGYLLARGAEIVIACAPNEDHKVDAYGWLCFETGFDRPVVHFVSVKEDYRGHGIGRALLKHVGADGPSYFTCRMPAVTKFMPLGVFRPEITRFEKPRAIERLGSRFDRDEHRAQRDVSSRKSDKVRRDRRREARDNLEETE